jgi:hypothetical protein
MGNLTMVAVQVQRRSLLYSIILRGMRFYFAFRMAWDIINMNLIILRVQNHYFSLFLSYYHSYSHLQTVYLMSKCISSIPTFVLLPRIIHKRSETSLYHSETLNLSVFHSLSYVPISNIASTVPDSSISPYVFYL